MTCPPHLPKSRPQVSKMPGANSKDMPKSVQKSSAQQLEDWANQQVILKSKNAHRAMAKTFDKIQSAREADWRTPAKFGVERYPVRHHWCPPNPRPMNRNKSLLHSFNYSQPPHKIRQEFCTIPSVPSRSVPLWRARCPSAPQSYTS